MWHAIRKKNVSHNARRPPVPPPTCSAAWRGTLPAAWRRRTAAHTCSCSTAGGTRTADPRIWGEWSCEPWMQTYSWFILIVVINKFILEIIHPWCSVQEHHSALTCTARRAPAGRGRGCWPPPPTPRPPSPPSRAARTPPWTRTGTGRRVWVDEWMRVVERMRVDEWMKVGDWMSEWEWTSGWEWVNESEWMSGWKWATGWVDESGRVGESGRVDKSGWMEDKCGNNHCNMGGWGLRQCVGEPLLLA